MCCNLNLTLYLHCHIVTFTSLCNYWTSNSQISLGTTLFCGVTLYSFFRQVSLFQRKYFHSIWNCWVLPKCQPFNIKLPVKAPKDYGLLFTLKYVSESLIKNFHSIMGHICLQQQMTDTSLQQARSILHLDKLSTRELTLRITVIVLHSTQVETTQTVLTLPFSLSYILCEQNVL